MTTGARAGAALLAIIAALTAGASVIAPHEPGRQFPDLAYAPPMLPHVFDDSGRLHRPFIYPLRLADRLEHKFVEDRTMRVPLTLAGGAPDRTPWLLLGGDALGRDLFARLLIGARLSLGVSVVAAAGALFLGALVGALAGFHRGFLDDLLMRVADFVIVLPAIYVVVVLRAAMPLVLTTGQVFWTMAAVLSLVAVPCLRTATPHRCAEDNGTQAGHQRQVHQPVDDLPDERAARQAGRVGCADHLCECRARLAE